MIAARRSPGPRIPFSRGAWLPLTALLVLATACRPQPADAPAGGIVLVVLDTVRADHLGAYGYPRDTSPNLDRLAGEGELYLEAFSQSPWTLPSVATMLTGQPPRVHGAGRGAGGGMYPVRAEVRTLAERFGNAGYRTGAVVNVVFCSPGSGIERGFEAFDYHASDASNRGHRGAAETTDAALAWLRTVRGQPFFLLVHYFDAHLTYDPPAPHDTRFEPDGTARIPAGFGSAEQVFALRRGEIRLSARERESLVARYDGEIHYLDREFGRLRREMESLGIWDDSLVVVAGDHGEEFWDHGGFEHGHSHYRELLRVPLIVRRPGGTPERRSGRVRLLDLAPELLRYAGLPVPEELPGQPLSQDGAAHAVAEGSLWGGDLVSVRTDEGTLILERGSGRRRFFAPDDPAERSDALDRHRDAARRLEAVLRSLEPTERAGEAPWNLSDEQRERLRSLGYLK